MKNLSRQEINNLAVNIKSIIREIQDMSDSSLTNLLYQLMLDFGHSQNKKQLKLPFKNKE